MAKIICAFPGTSSGALFILLKMKEPNQRIHYLKSPHDNDVERFLSISDTLIIQSWTGCVEKLIELGVEFDLVYPDPVTSPSRYTTVLAMEGFRLREIHDMIHGWRDRLLVLQSYKQPNVTHIVLAEGQSLVDTHGV